jgi:GNAT superfamily N-acetyltransferase
VAGKEADAAALVEALTRWAKEDLLVAYEALGFALHWQGTATWRAVWEGGDLRAVAARLAPRDAARGPVRFCYAARDEAALREALAAVPPEPGGLVCAPHTACYAALRSLPEDDDGNEVFYVYAGEATPEGAEVSQLTIEEAVTGGLSEPWQWPNILGEQSAPRPIHVIRQGERIVAVAAAGCPTALTEEVRGVWVAADLRRQGLGRMVVSSATRDILARGRLPAYATSRTNVASQRTAESVGYVRQGEMLRVMVVAA